MVDLTRRSLGFELKKGPAVQTRSGITIGVVDLVGNSTEGARLSSKEVSVALLDSLPLLCPTLRRFVYICLSANWIADGDKCGQHVVPFWRAQTNARCLFDDDGEDPSERLWP